MGTTGAHRGAAERSDGTADRSQSRSTGRLLRIAVVVRLVHPATRAGEVFLRVTSRDGPQKF